MLAIGPLKRLKPSTSPNLPLVHNPKPPKNTNQSTNGRRSCYLFEGCGQKFLDALLATARVELYMEEARAAGRGACWLLGGREGRERRGRGARPRIALSASAFLYFPRPEPHLFTPLISHPSKPSKTEL